MKYWITHPNLTPDHDQQIEAGALATWARSGWQVREDQADPDEGAVEPADPRVSVEAEPEPLDTDDDPASDAEPSTEHDKES